MLLHLGVTSPDERGDGESDKEWSQWQRGEVRFQPPRNPYLLSNFPTNILQNLHFRSLSSEVVGLERIQTRDVISPGI